MTGECFKVLKKKFCNKNQLEIIKFKSNFILIQPNLIIKETQSLKLCTFDFQVAIFDYKINYSVKQMWT